MADTLRKELKRPDQFMVTGKKWLIWSVEHQRVLLMAGAGLVLVLLVIAGYDSYRKANVRQANAELAVALTAFEGERWEEAATGMREVAQRWSGAGGVTHVALLYAAQADIHAGKLDAAKATLEEVVAASGLPKYLKQQATYNLGFILEEQGDTAAAAERYAATTAVDGPYTSPALLAEARVRAALGEIDQAKALYRRHLDEFPESPERATAESRLAAL